MELVLVEYEYQYTAQDGRLVYIVPNERYILVAKTNDHWWHVRKDQQTKPFYVPAQYVRELPSDCQALDPNPRSLTSPDVLTDRELVDTPRTRSDSIPKVYAFQNHAHRMSTFGYFGGFSNIETLDHRQPVLGRQMPDRFGNIPPHHLNRHSLIPGFTFTSESPSASYSEHNCPLPHIPPKSPSGLLQMDSASQPLVKDEAELRSSEGQTESLGDPQSVLSHDSDINKTILDIQTPEMADLPPPVLPRSPASTETAPSQSLSLGQAMGPAHMTGPSLKHQVEDESDEDAVYANVADLRRSISDELPLPLPPPPCSPFLDAEGWEVHTDQESGQEYYYHQATGRTTWDNPLDPLPLLIDHEATAEEPYTPSPSQSPLALSPVTFPPSPAAWTPDWEQLLDETSGRHYFHNPVSGETSWEPPEPLSLSPCQMEALGGYGPQGDLPPPLPEEDYPAPPAELTQLHEERLVVAPVSLCKEYTFSHIPRANLDRNAPPGWNLFVDSDGTWVFTSEHSHEQWIKSLDDQGQTYYYLKDGTRSQWNLPEAPVVFGQPKMGNGVDTDSVSMMTNWRHTMNPAQLSTSHEDAKFHPTHRRNASDHGNERSSASNSPETRADGLLRLWRNADCLASGFLQYTVQHLEKAGILNKTKVSENGKRVRKNWAQSWTVLHGGVLIFHKDPKFAATGTLNKTSQIVPEVALDLRGAMIGWAPKDKSSKKNVLELKSRNGMEFLVQYDTESIITDWHKVLVDTIRQLDYQEHRPEEDDRDVSEKSSSTDRDLQSDRSPGPQNKRIVSRPSVVSSSGETDQWNVRAKLMKFLMKRPTLQAVKEKGYFRDNVFGSDLATLCAQERTTIPSFVEKCIKAVERRGLDIDGIYRVSGNLAIIQKLRFKADHEELDLEDGQWEDIHVITGALKLFFRELREPLFPFSHFNRFIAAIRTFDYSLKVSHMRELVKSLPPANHDTMELLFGHLHKVIEFGEENRMTVQNVAIVFGPTLLRQETESANITMHMVFQNQIVELILNEYEHIFYSR